MIVKLAFDEGPGAGLGHRRRVEALAAELAARGHECELVALPESIWDDAELIEGDVVVVDSYRMRADDAERFCARAVVAIDDLARDLAVDVVVDPSPGADGGAHFSAGRVLAGAAYALVAHTCARVGATAVDAPVERVLITMGAADAEGVGAGVAAAVLAASTGVEVRLVVGPWGAKTVPDGVDSVVAPDGLVGELAAAGVVVTAGGVTMLEACRLGRPVVALALAANQEQAVAGLACDGAVVLATPTTVAAEVGALIRDRSRRFELATAASAAVDGKGATRVADAIEQLLR